MQLSSLGPAAVRDLTAAPRPLSVVVLGAGKIGRVIATMLADSGDYRVCLVDHDAHRLDGLPRAIAVRAGDPTEPGTCAALLAGADAVLNALPFHAAVLVATAAPLHHSRRGHRPSAPPLLSRTLRMLGSAEVW